MPHSVHPTPRENTPAPGKVLDLSKLWWNINVPKEQWTEECPPYLLGQSEKNIGILSRKDEDFKRYTWQQVEELVRTNNIHHFHRPSSQLRGYLAYTYHLKKTYGSVLSYIQQHRLGWPTITPSGDAPFSNPSDYKILYNDWPYFVEEGIKHLVVWTKFQIDEDEETGEVTREAERQIDEFIRRTFCEGEAGKKMEREKIVWFKNWKSLKSVHALEHFHVMLYKPPEVLVDVVTQGDRPTCESWMATTS
ncbi:uncharacterized protein Z519_11382 [Cladophialophora bantiana CBS 173.52]|uniref:N-acetylglucosamine-induced protein 1 n=1 Tax=Cladophialophora bantiana (strain ATCC 10958 / CBS 173.52 / CDC B-1940 / NIH 8579) TaxID=1442370 RepID=A0A0D2EDR0_CLAB1|nr:uncharacterized protein Z519_11382 [Cladophialophora bantiana CBS 173.52]KIW88271.1 hypothetical protein Z519_11382 [Cladophialophora bantiana CBS 173.52]